MSASRAFFDAISAHRRARTASASEDDDTTCTECQGTTCTECQGTGLDDGPDGPPCQYCDGTGVW